MPMKKGSGSLDFEGTDDDDDSNDSSTDETPEPSDAPTTEPKPAEPEPTESEPDGDHQDQEFPYFVRRSKVGDERDERIELWLRDDVLEDESDFRSDVAEALGENGEISKTDAREFALKYAFENPGGVAELMREEGYGLTD